MYTESCLDSISSFLPPTQIKVAVSADRDCIRAYKPQISSTNYNTLTLNIKTAEPDNLLFYLGSNRKVSFWHTFTEGDGSKMF